MRTIIKHRNTLALLFALFAAVIATSALVSYMAAPALAGGLPSTNPLFYSGFLTDKAGKPLSGSKNISVALWDAASGGKQQCATSPIAKTLTRGRFRVTLVKSCVTAIQDYNELWVEVVVDGTSMGRTKIGAVPFVATIPDTLKVSGDASFSVHSNTDKLTPGKKMLELKTGAKAPKEVFSVDNRGFTRIGAGVANSPLEVYWPSGIPVMMLSLTNPYSNYGAIRFYGNPDAGGGSIAFSGTPSFTNGEISGLKQDYPSAVRGASAVESASGHLRFHVQDGKAVHLNSLVINKNGNVGVGTASPKDRLDVLGNIKFGGKRNDLKLWEGSAKSGGDSCELACGKGYCIGAYKDNTSTKTTCSSTADDRQCICIGKPL